MQPISHHEFFFDSQITRLVEEQKKTNEMLTQLLEILKPPTKGVEQVELDRNDKPNQRKRR
jgi:hypothetical protein